MLPRLPGEECRAQDRLDRSKENLRQAIQGIGAEYDKAVRYEYSLRRELDQQESEISVLQSDIVFYQTLNYEVESLKTRLNSLLNIQTQVNASKELESLKTSNISVVDQAEAPNKPISPLIYIILFIAGLPLRIAPKDAYLTMAALIFLTNSGWM